MTGAALLADAYGRIKSAVHEAVDGLGTDALVHRIAPEANTVAWLVWHLARVQDHHISQVAGKEQVWTTSEWPSRFGLPPDPQLTGYGDTPEQVASVRVDSAEVLTGYYDAVHEASLRYLRGVAADDLDVVVDRAWDPPVTLGVRLVSVIADDLQHVGQAAYLRGVIER